MEGERESPEAKAADNIPSIQPGMVVELKSGSPPMVASGTEVNDAGETLIHCRFWNKKAAAFQEETFQQFLLVPSEEEEKKHKRWDDD